GSTRPPRRPTGRIPPTPAGARTTAADGDRGWRRGTSASASSVVAGRACHGNPRRARATCAAVSDWKRYPYVPAWGDPPWFTFPDVDGYRADLGMATYFVDGFLRGRGSGHEYAFMTIVTDMHVLGKRLRASFYTFALYDRARRHYGTYTDYDFPAPPRIRRRHKLDAARGHLDLRYAASAGSVRWANARDAGDALVPFAWTLDLRGRDPHGAALAPALPL